MRDEVSLKKNFSSLEKSQKRRFLIDDMKMKQDCIENHELNKKITVIDLWILREKNYCKKYKGQRLLNVHNCDNVTYVKMSLKNSSQN